MQLKNIWPDIGLYSIWQACTLYWTGFWPSLLWELGYCKISCTFRLYMSKLNYDLHVHISSLGRCYLSPLPSFLFQSQVGHSRPTLKPLSCPQKWTACIMTSQQCHFIGGLSIKKQKYTLLYSDESGIQVFGIHMVTVYNLFENLTFYIKGWVVYVCFF